MRDKLIFLSTVILALAICSPGLASQSILIKDGTVITVTKGTIENCDVLLKDGKITDVGKNLSVPKNAVVIDAAGKYVMPGIIDTHSHIGVYSWPGVPAHSDGNEATHPITPHVRAKDSFNADDPAIKRAIAGGVTTIQSLPGSANLIGGQTFIVKLKPDKTAEEMEIAGAPKGMKMALGENPKRVYGRRNEMPSTRMGNYAMMRSWFVKAQDYDRKWKRFEKKKDEDDDPPSRDLKLEALAELLNGDFLVHVHCYTKDEMLRMIAVADEFGFKIRSFEHTLEGYKIADTLAAREIAACTWTDWWGFKVEAFEGIPQSPGIMASRGVKVVLHSDSGNQIQRLWLDAAKAVRYGMDRQKALEALTINAAWTLGLEDRIGSIEKGKDADIAIFSGHPFNIYTLVDMTIIDGEIVFDRSTEPSRLESGHEN